MSRVSPGMGREKRTCWLPEEPEAISDEEASSAHLAILAAPLDDFA